MSRADILLRLPLFLAMSLSAAAEQLIYIGTYTRTTSQGIYAVRFDPNTGTLGVPKLVAETPNPSFVALSPDRSHLYTVSESSASVVSFAVDPATGRLSPLAMPSVATAPGAGPRHFAFAPDGRRAFVINELDSTLSSTRAPRSARFPRC